MTRAYKLSLTGLVLGTYAMLLTILVIAGMDLASLLRDMSASLTIGVAGIVTLLVSPTVSPGPDSGTLSTRDWLAGCGQQLRWPQQVALGACGFFFGALMHQVLDQLMFT